MADYRSFWFPSSTGGYTTPSGKSVRLKIYYEDSGLGSPSNTNLDDCHILKIGKIDIPLEITPSGTIATSQMRFASCDFTIYNAVYDSSNNFFEQYSILNETYKFKTWIDIYVDGSLYWRGIIVFDQIKRFDYYPDGSDLKYRKIKIKAYDALAYFAYNNVTLSDVSYSNGMGVDTLFSNIIQEIEFGSSDYDFDDNLKVTEYGAVESPVKDMNIAGQTSGDQVINWIKEWMLATGTFVYNLKGKVNITLRGNVGSNLAIDNDKLLGMARIQNENKIEHIKYDADLAYHGDKMPSAYSGTTFDHSTASGTENDNTNKNFIHDGKAILAELYEAGTESIFDTPPTTGDSTTTTQLTDAAVGRDFQTDGLESGDFISLQYSSGAYNSHSSYVYRTIIDLVNSEDLLTYDQIGSSPLNDIYLITLAFNNRRYKTKKLHDLIAQSYIDYFLTSPDILKLDIRDFDTYSDFQRKYTTLGNSYKIKSAKIDIVKDIIQMKLMQVA